MRTLLIALFLVLVSACAAKAQDTCSGTITGINFGAVDVLAGTAVDVTGTVTVSCNDNGPHYDRICVGLGPGSGGADATYRYAVGPGGVTVQYQLYRDSTRTTIWGARPVAARYIGMDDDTTVSVPVYARFFGGQADKPPGTYTSSFSGSSGAAVFRLHSNYTNCNTDPINYDTPVTHPSFTVTASPAANCSVTPNNLSFGNRGLLTAVINVSTTMSVRCTNTTPYSVSLNGGLSNAAPAERRMVNGANWVTYGLYRDSARQNVWGSTIGSNTVSGTGTGSTTTLTVFGQVPAQATPPPAFYSDTVVTTVTY